MKHFSIIRKYISYLWHEARIHITGLLELIVSIIIGEIWPNVFVWWGLFLVTFGLAIVVSSYFAFANLYREYQTKNNNLKNTISKLKSEINELRNKQPSLIVGFQGSDNRLTKSLHFQLNPLPPKSTIDAQIEETVQEELERLAEKERKSNSRHMGVGLLRPNPNYKQELKQYEKEYRAYTRRQFEFLITKDRTHAIRPIIENTGYHPANNVDIEFKMPEEYKKPADHQYPPLEHSFYDNPLYQDYLNDSEMTEEKIMLMAIEHICERPSEPKKFTDITTSALYNLLPGAFTSPWIETRSISEKLSNVTGPTYKTQQGIHYITYHIDQLVQHRPLDLDPFYIWLGDINHSTIWEIIVQITSADLQQPHEETLLIKIEIIDSTNNNNQNMPPT